MKNFQRWLVVACVALLSTACTDEAGNELKTMLDWDPEYTKNWAPSIGTLLPKLAVADTAGEARDFESLTGEKGLVMFFVRSTNW